MKELVSTRLRGFKLVKILTCMLRNNISWIRRAINWPNVRYHCWEGGALLWTDRVKFVLLFLFVLLWTSERITVPSNRLSCVFHFRENIKNLCKTSSNVDPNIKKPISSRPAYLLIRENIASVFLLPMNVKVTVFLHIVCKWCLLGYLVGQKHTQQAARINSRLFLCYHNWFRLDNEIFHWVKYNSLVLFTRAYYYDLRS